MYSGPSAVFFFEQDLPLAPENATTSLTVGERPADRLVEKPRFAGLFEADARTRTGDPFITSEVLYQLSYVGARASCEAPSS